MATPSDGKKRPKAAEELAEKAQAAYQWWDHLATFHPEDPWWIGGLKLLFRAVGVIVLIALSPLILLGLAVAFIAVL